MPLLSQAFFIGLDQFGGIVEVFDIVPPVPFKAVPGLPYKVLDGQVFIFLDCAFIEKAINFEGLVFVSVTIHKY